MLTFRDWLLLICTLGILLSKGSHSIVGSKDRATKTEIEDTNTHKSDGQRSFQVDYDTCPDVWFVRRNGTCECGSDIHGAVSCDKETKEVSILDCYCMTRDSTSNQTVTVVGPCVFNCANMTGSYQDSIYHRVPANPSQLDQTCSYLHRGGTLCGKCVGGYVPPAYSYDLECIKCTHGSHNWWKYVMVAFGPLTVFIIIILVFRISILSPKLNAYAFIVQNAVTPVNVRILLAASKYSTPLITYIIKIFTSIYGIWNLDFFRTLLKGVCLNVSTLQVLALDYLVAFYPMLLMVIAYTLVELHACGFRPVLCVWRPFHHFFARFRRQWDIQTSIMDAFITFFLLSTTKLLNVSFDLLIFTRLYTADGHSVRFYLYYDPNVKYFRGEHLPYAILALTVLVLFILLPVCLLLLYPFRCFRSCLMKCRLNTRTLEMFVKAFQQYYKDGRGGTTDCRWFSGFYLFIRFGLFFSYTITLSGFAYLLVTIIFIIAGITVIAVQPYKKEYALFNVVDSTLLLWLAILCTSVSYLNFAGLEDRHLYGSSSFLIGIVSLIPLAYILAVVMHWMYKRSNCRVHNRILSYIRPQNHFEESLPDRVSRPHRYKDSFGFVPLRNGHEEVLTNHGTAK